MHPQQVLDGTKKPSLATKVVSDKSPKKVSKRKVPNENFRRQLNKMEQHLTNSQRQLQEIKLHAANLREQLREKTQQEETDFQRQLREMEQQLARMERQLREKDLALENSESVSREREKQMADLQRQLGEKELEEANLHGQLREKNQQQENLLTQFSEIEQQLRGRNEHEEILQRQLEEIEQQLENSEIQQVAHFQRQLQEKELQEASLREQLREKEQEEENSQRQLREMEQQVTSSQEQLREKEDESDYLQVLVTALEVELRAKNQEMDELEITLSEAQQQVLSERQRQRQQTPDWVISRDQIQLMTDKFLGGGAWGSVVEGKYCGCAVAVKQIHNLILSPHNLSLFEREMDIASRCRHPCLLQFIGATNDDESPLFVTELMELSLRALLERRSLSATEVSIISLDVTRALSYLHQKTPPIIHRDISSANVLLWRQGDQWRGKVSDYGTANFMQQTMTVAPGARNYIAPEALTSNQTVKVDVYSFGVLLCEMCIRELPDPERRDQQIAMVTKRLLRALVRRCVQTEPGARPNMEEIIEELEEPV
ncbi:uncharacterized protein LOC144651483 [Oculina patagonica]